MAGSSKNYGLIFGIPEELGCSAWQDSPSYVIEHTWDFSWRYVRRWLIFIVEWCHTIGGDPPLRIGENGLFLQFEEGQPLKTRATTNTSAFRNRGLWFCYRRLSIFPSDNFIPPTLSPKHPFYLRCAPQFRKALSIFLSTSSKVLTVRHSQSLMTLRLQMKIEYRRFRLRACASVTLMLKDLNREGGYGAGILQATVYELVTHVWLLRKVFREVIQCHTLRFHIHIGCVLVWCFTLEISASKRNQPTAEDYSIKQYLKLQLDFSCFFKASWLNSFSLTTLLASKILRKIR